MKKPRSRRTATVRKPRSRPAPRRPSTGLRALPTTKAARPDAEATEDLAEFPIVGIGASAGGIEALRALLGEIPLDVEMAFVVVSHLSPDRESFLPTVLSSATRLPVTHADKDTKIEPGHVYVVPPNRFIQLTDGHLRLTQRPDDSRQFTPINHFFGSLATFGQNRGIGVVLSGNASDGALGIREIRGAGGVTMAQEPTTARFDSMPRAAIASGVDYVLPPPQIAQELLRIASHPSVKPTGQPRLKRLPPNPQQYLQEVLRILREGGGVDFSNYKTPTILRRLNRQMVLRRIASIEDYVEYLKTNPDEVTSLGQSILIHVTRFFRDPDAFEALRRIVRSRVHDRGTKEALRVWIPGCATGEEAYSIAITLSEIPAAGGRSLPLQVFGTDVSEQAIERARKGVYPEAIESDVPPDVLRKYFSRIDHFYRIAQSIRDVCLFAKQDVIQDPPFSRVDLVICRNLLIYFDQALQKRVLGMLHYALQPDGLLMLGPSETTGPEAESFESVDKKYRIFSRRQVRVHAPPSLKGGFPHVRGGRLPEAPGPRGETRMQRDVERVLLDRFAPPTVVVDEEFQVQQLRGDVERYFSLPQGNASLSVFKIARSGLVSPLRELLDRARATKKTVRRKRVPVRVGRLTEEVTIEAVPIRTAEDRRHFLLLFEPVARGVQTKESPKRRQRGVNRDLERELAVTREELQSNVQDLEAANEELQSANEEILSSNEELQSTNEELDTAREELQSTNEEIITVNDELHSRNNDLALSNSNLLNLLAGVRMPIVLVDADLRISHFTPLAEKMLNLIPSDVGRPLSQIKPNVDCPRLIPMINESLSKATLQEEEVQDSEGRWYSLRVQPYKDVDGRITGSLIVIVDIDSLKRRQSEAVMIDAIVEVCPGTLVVHGPDHRIMHASLEFCQLVEADRSSLVGRSLLHVGHGRWNDESLRNALAEVWSKGVVIRDLDVTYRDGGPARRLVLSAKKLDLHERGEFRILMALEPRG